MKEKIKYTAFLDVLGFAQHIEKNITNDKEAEEFYDKLKLITQYLEYLKNDTYENLDIDFLKDIIIKYTWISDTFVLTIEYDSEKSDIMIPSMMIYILSLSITSVHHFFAKEFGLLIRGAISSKYTFIKDEILLGAGIFEAHNLESKIAINPRVIFAKDILTDGILEKLSLLDKDDSLNIISKDCDGYYFINYIGALQDIPPMIEKPTSHVSKEKLEVRAIQSKVEALSCYIQIIDDGLKIDDVSIKSKYMWLEQYVNRIISSGIFSYNIIGNQESIKQIYQ